MPNRPFGTKWSSPVLRSGDRGISQTRPLPLDPARSRGAGRRAYGRHRAGQRKIVHTAAAASATTTTTTTITTVTSSS